MLLLGTSFKRHPMCYCICFFPLPHTPWTMSQRNCSSIHRNPKPDLWVISQKQTASYCCYKPPQFWSYLLWQHKLAQADWWCIILTSNPQTSGFKKWKIISHSCYMHQWLIGGKSQYVLRTHYSGNEDESLYHLLMVLNTWILEKSEHILGRKGVSTNIGII